MSNIVIKDVVVLSAVTQLRVSSVPSQFRQGYRHQRLQLLHPHQQDDMLIMCQYIVLTHR